MRSFSDELCFARSRAIFACSRLTASSVGRLRRSFSEPMGLRRYEWPYFLGIGNVKQLGYTQRCTSSRLEAALPSVGPREINNAMRAQVIAHFIEMKLPFSLRQPGMLFDSAAAYKDCPFRSHSPQDSRLMRYVLATVAAADRKFSLNSSARSATPNAPVSQASLRLCRRTPRDRSAYHSCVHV